jgi:hypothetical protein
MAETEPCAHPGCNCRATKDSKYCSEYCQRAGDHIAIKCDCGHPACRM